jgi:type II secretory pathway component GspD/PulD (secretin)
MKKKLFVFGMLAVATTNSYAALTDELKGIMETKQPAQQQTNQPSGQSSSQPSGNLTQSLQQMQTASIKDEIERKLYKPITVNVNNVSFEYLFSLISNYAKVPIVLKDFESTTSSTSTSTLPLSGSMGGSTAPMPVGTGTSGTTTTSFVGGSSKFGYVSYYTENKPIKYVLDELCGLYDLSYEITDDGKVVVYRYKSDVFQVRLPALVENINLTDDYLTLNYKKDFYNNLEKSLQGLLKDTNSKLTINDMGYITVRARPSEVELVKKTVEQINKYFTTTIPLRITVMIVRLNDKKTMGLNLFSWLQSNVGSGLSLKTGYTGSINPINAFTIGVSGAKLSAIIQALGEIGDVKIIEDNQMRALNYRPIMWKPLTKQRILANVQLTYMQTAPTGTGTGGTIATPQLTTQTEDIDQGSNLMLVPYVLDEKEGKIVINFYRSQKDILKLENWQVNFGNAGSTQIILPTVKSYSQLQGTELRKGEQLILFSSTLTTQQIQKEGIPFLQNIPILGYLFGTEVKENDKFQVVVTIGYED